MSEMQQALVPESMQQTMRELHAPRISRTMRAMAEAHVELDGNSIDTTTLKPSQMLVKAIADRVVRLGNSEIPGYAYMDDLFSVLETRERTIQFQHNLVLALKEHLTMHTPQAVKHQPYLNHPSYGFDYSYDSLGMEAFQFSAYDGRAVQAFHLDNLRQSYVSLCYGPNKNIAGGVPRLLDALRLKEDLNVATITDIVQLNTLKAEYTEVHTPHDIEGKLQERHREAATKYITTFDILDSLRLPILIFSNRLEDGILHGATSAETADRTKPADRPISYAAIKHLPFVKTDQFADSHVLRV